MEKNQLALAAAGIFLGGAVIGSVATQIYNRIKSMAAAEKAVETAKPVAA